MEITMKIKIVPFSVPSHVYQDKPAQPRQNGLMIGSNPGISLADLDASVLNELCNQVRESVFLKANKYDPYIGNGYHSSMKAG